MAVKVNITALKHRPEHTDWNTNGTLYFPKYWPTFTFNWVQRNGWRRSIGPIIWKIEMYYRYAPH